MKSTLTFVLQRMSVLDSHMSQSLADCQTCFVKDMINIWNFYGFFYLYQRVFSAVQCLKCNDVNFAAGISLTAISVGFSQGVNPPLLVLLKTITECTSSFALYIFENANYIFGLEQLMNVSDLLTRTDPALQTGVNSTLHQGYYCDFVIHDFHELKFFLMQRIT